MKTVIKNMRNIIIILTILITGCTAQQRFNRLVKNHPEFITKTTDTMYYFDSVLTEHQVLDTIVNVKDSIIKLDDTIILRSFKGLKGVITEPTFILNYEVQNGELHLRLMVKNYTKTKYYKVYNKTTLNTACTWWKDNIPWYIIALIVSLSLLFIYILINLLIKKIS